MLHFKLVNLVLTFIIAFATFSRGNSQELKERKFIFSFGTSRITKGVFVDAGNGIAPPRASLIKVNPKRWTEFLSSPCLTVQDKLTGDTLQIEYYRVIYSSKCNSQYTDKSYDIRGRCFPDELTKQVDGQDFFEIKWIEIKNPDDTVVLLKFQFVFVGKGRSQKRN